MTAFVTCIILIVIVSVIESFFFGVLGQSLKRVV